MADTPTVLISSFLDSNRNNGFINPFDEPHRLLEDIDKAKLGPYDAHDVFLRIILNLEQTRKWLPENTESLSGNRERLDVLINELKRAAEDYFRKLLHEFFKGDRLTAVWRECSRALINPELQEYPLLLRAYENLKQHVEGLIEIAKKEKSDADAIGDLNDEENDSVPQPFTLTAAQRVLAIRYFLKFHQIKHLGSPTIARLLTVMNGGKNYKDTYDKVRDPNLHFADKGNDARTVQNLFEKLGETGIAKMIENDLDELAKKKSR